MLATKSHSSTSENPRWALRQEKPGKGERESGNRSQQPVREGGTSAKGCPGTWEVLSSPVERRVGQSERKPDCRPPDAKSGQGTFDLLGFTHLWRKSHKGKWVLGQQTAKDRFRRAMRAVSEWC